MPDDVVRLRLESDDFPCDNVQVFEIAGKEAISQPFAFTIGIVVLSQEGLDVDAVEGADASLIFEVGGEELRRVHGMIAEIEDLLDTEPETRGYRLKLVPRMHRLALVHAQEIFMETTVPDIIRKKLELVGLGDDDVEMRLVGSYPQREFVVQYKETDLAFISRLAEHEGIAFFFEHEGGRERIVFTDQRGGYRPVPGHEAAPFRARGDRRDVYQLSAKTRLVPRAHVVHDYNYRTPLTDPTGNAEATSGLGGGVVEYGAHVKSPEEALRLAKIRAEETEATHRVFSGESDLGWVTAGAPFILENHPRLGDAQLLVTEVEHAATQPVALHGGKKEIGYSNRFRAIDASLTYRPPRLTPRPRIHGVINGVVEHEIEGTESKFALIDEDGRYLVRMMFDTSKPGERRAVSRRVRMAQPHSGPNYGVHFPLKPGTEVLIVHIDGDPDRPVIISTVPNAVTPSPVARSSAPAHRIKTATGILIEMKDA
jgi:type VI secretion system secreted protein VgrG